MHSHNSRTISDSPHNAGYDYLDELEYMAHITHSKNTTVIGVIDQFWTIAVTEHLPFREIADMITKDKVSKCIAMLNDTLKKTGKRKPRLAVAALNVHAGEGGLFGNEEIEEISPANELPRSPDERDLRFAPTSYGVSIGSYHNASRGGELVRLRRVYPPQEGLSAFGGLKQPGA